MAAIQIPETERQRPVFDHQLPYPGHIVHPKAGIAVIQPVACRIECYAISQHALRSRKYDRDQLKRLSRRYIQRVAPEYLRGRRCFLRPPLRCNE